MKHSFVKTLQIIALAWLLLLMGSNHSTVLCKSNTEAERFFCRYPVLEADGDTLVPQILTESKLDICTDNTTGKEFILTIDLGETIAKTDSLFDVELVLMYNSDSVILDGAWTMGTLAEFANGPYIYATKDDIGSYDTYTIVFGSTELVNNELVPLYGESALIQVSGKYFTKEISCTDIAIYYVDFGSSFKKPYDRYMTHTLPLCATNVYDSTKTISANMLEYGSEDSIKINEMTDIVTVPFTVRVADMKNLSSFDVEFELNEDMSRNVEFVEESGTSNCSDYSVEATPNGYKLSVVLADRGMKECDGKFDWEWFRVKIRRKNTNGSLNNLKYTVTNIKQNACSMNGLSGNMVVSCPNITSIEDRDDTNFVVINAGDKIIVRSAYPILGYEIYNTLGEVVKSDKHGIYSKLHEIELSKYDFISGLYLLRLEFGDGMLASPSPIKLIIN